MSSGVFWDPETGSLCLCGWAEWLILSWTTAEWTSGSSFQRAAIIRTGLTGLLRGRLSKNTPYLCDSMMTLTRAAVSRSFNFPPVPFSPPLPCASPLFLFWSRDKPSGESPPLVLIRQQTEQRLGRKASVSAAFHAEVSVFSLRQASIRSLVEAWSDFSSVRWHFLSSWEDERWRGGRRKENKAAFYGRGFDCWRFDTSLDFQFLSEAESLSAQSFKIPVFQINGDI